MLKKAVEEFGDLGGIVFNRQTSQLVGGHQRVSVIPKSAEIVIEKEYDEPTRTGTVAEGYVLISGERFRYRQVDWPLAREEAANISANKQGGEWEDDKLREILADLVSQGIDMDLVGFTTEELENLMGSAEIYDAQCDEDDVGEPPKEPRSKLADVYELGSHRLMCGDSTSIDAIDRLMSGAKADMVFTDPPYGMKLDTDWTGGKNILEAMPNIGSRKATSKKYSKVIGDHDDFKPELISSIFAASPSAKEVFIFGADYFAELLPDRNSGSWVVWDKRGDASADKAFGATFELCWSKTSHKRETARIRAGIFGAKDDSKKRVHPTQKPVQLPEWFMKKWGEGLTAVLDLFGGSGSTLIACEKTKRKCYMMELDPHYVDVIVSRYVKFSGNSKIKRNGEEIDWLKSE